jgi:hypothetical protein
MPPGRGQCEAGGVHRNSTISAANPAATAEIAVPEALSGQQKRPNLLSFPKRHGNCWILLGMI